MNTAKILAIVLILTGALGLAYGSFNYTKDTHSAKIGAVELSVKDTDRTDIPGWLSVAVMVAGAVLLLSRK